MRTALALLALLVCTTARGDFSFALLGDTPYGAGEEIAFIDMLEEINRTDVAFVVHVGDFKNGWTSCGDAVFDQRRTLFEASQHPFIYIPGDNEWSDCSRLFAGGYEPLERLNALRQRFFRGTHSLGLNKLKLSRQSDTPAAPFYPEHMRWQVEDVLFVTLNIPGGDNNQAMPKESAERTAAAIDWLRLTFALALAQKNRGIVIMMQANPFLRSGHPRRGHDKLLAALAQETAGFDGSVLLGHGDTHVHRVDHPLKDPSSGKPLTNFTRAEVFGSPDVNWLRVGVSRIPDSGGRIRFAISPGR